MKFHNSRGTSNDAYRRLNVYVLLSFIPKILFQPEISFLNSKNFRLSAGVQDAIQVTMPELKVENVADQKHESLTRVIFSKIITMRVNTAEPWKRCHPMSQSFLFKLKYVPKTVLNDLFVQYTPMFWLYVASLLQNILV